MSDDPLYDPITGTYVSEGYKKKMGKVNVKKKSKIKNRKKAARGKNRTNEKLNGRV
jgi:hypothetical protein